MKKHSKKHQIWTLSHWYMVQFQKFFDEEKDQVLGSQKIYHFMLFYNKK